MPNISWNLPSEHSEREGEAPRAYALGGGDLSACGYAQAGASPSSRFA